MTEQLPRRSEERGGAPAGYEPVGVRSWPGGQPGPWLPVTTGAALPLLGALLWLGALAELAAMRQPVPAWIAGTFAAGGLTMTLGWLAATSRGNRWFNAYLWATDRNARLRIPLRELPACIRDDPPAGVLK